MLFVGCDVFSSSEEPERKPLKAPDITFPVEVEYRVYGTFEDHYGPIDFNDESAKPESAGDTLPWSYSFTLDSPQVLYVNTRGIEGHTITSEIWVNGELYSSLENTIDKEMRSNLVWTYGETLKVRYHISEWIQGGFESGTVSVSTGDGFDSYNLLDYLQSSHTFFTESYDTEPGFTATMHSTTSYSGDVCYLAYIALEVDNLFYPMVLKNVCQPGRHTLSATVPTK